MKDLIIIGAGDFSKEIRWLIERINQANPTWNILGFVDDGVPTETDRDGLPVLGTVDFLMNIQKETDVVMAIANGHAKENIFKRIQTNSKLDYPVIVDPSAVLSDRAIMNFGSIVCGGAIVMPYAVISSFCHVNWNATIGHDTVLGEFCTVFPGANVSGRVNVGNRTLIGTSASIKQGLSIASDVIIGAGAVVINNINKFGTYIGVPAKLMNS